MGFGDEILAAGQAQRLWEKRHIPVVICDQHGKPRWHQIWAGNPTILRPDEAKRRSHYRLVSGPNARPYIVYPFTPETGWVFNKDFKCREHIAHIYLTNDERLLGVDCRKKHGKYILIEPWSKHPNLRWPLHHWNALVGLIEDRLPTYTVVQHTHKFSSGLEIDGAVQWPYTSFRETCGLIASSECYIRGESGLLHAAASFEIPTVAIWGGCMDWDVMGHYPKEVGVGVTAPFCGSFTACEHCREVMDGITPEQVMAGLLEALAMVPAGSLAQGA